MQYCYKLKENKEQNKTPIDNISSSERQTHRAYQNYYLHLKGQSFKK